MGLGNSYASNPPTNQTPTKLGAVRHYGYFATLAALNASIPSAFPGDTAYCGDIGPVTWSGTAWGFVNLTLSGFLYESEIDGLAAHAGGGQANATPLLAELTRVTTVATAGDSVLLPPSKPGMTLYVINHGANPMQVYGSGTDQIDDVASATGVSQMVSSQVIYTCNTSGAWYTNGLASGFVRGGIALQTFSSVDGLVAHAGGGQASAVALTAMMNRVATVVTGGDSVVLPPSVSGMDVTVTNAASNSLNVFPSAGGTGTETINALAANAAFALTGGKSVQFCCYTAGQWHTLPLVP